MAAHTALEVLEDQGFLKLLALKDSDVRIRTLRQGADAVDKGLHAGGAFSAVIPLVCLYYGGIIRADVESPTRPGQDLFVLSKGHAVAALASIYADIGYFSDAVLRGSRSWESILNGHPGPLLPGVHTSTGPMGQGLSVAEGFALAGRSEPAFDVYCMTGDGEMQEGTVWEAVMYAGASRLDNLCVVIDKNEGQLDNPRQLLFPMHLPRQLEAFGWRVFDVDATRCEPVLQALRVFRFQPRDGRPTAVVANTRKGWGAFSSFMAGHKVELPDSLVEQEMALQERRREERAAELHALLGECGRVEGGDEVRRRLAEAARTMNLEISGSPPYSVRPLPPRERTTAAAPRRKKIEYAASELPRLDSTRSYSPSSVITAAMKVLARDRRVVSIDADLASTSGLYEGVAHVDTGRAHNVGVAEANMMCIGEAYAALGSNAWVSTFCPFFNLSVLRRIAISQQERLEVMHRAGGWLTDGHGLDLTFLATAPDFETRVNGATHMGNDDLMLVREIAHVNVISLSCPQQVLAFIQWVMEGNRGLVYARIPRLPVAVLYRPNFAFEYGRGYWLLHGDADRAVIVSSGRAVHEALAAARILGQQGVPIGVADLPSFDPSMITELCKSGRPVIFAEQNNGYLWSRTAEMLAAAREPVDARLLMPVNTRRDSGDSRFIHSATYEQLRDAFALSPEKLAARVKNLLEGR